MHIAINHTTIYRFDSPASHGLLRLRVTPRSAPGQTVQAWDVAITGAAVEARYEDHNRNHTMLVSFGPGSHEVAIACAGVVETADAAGMTGRHSGFMPLWVFRKQTAQTKPGPLLRALAARFSGETGDTIGMLHALSREIGAAVRYEAGHTDANTSAEAALAAGRGVCQDHAHVFIGAARHLGIPARYVSGYLLMDDRTEQDAGHAWAEAHVAGLGWVGFDVSNAICPDDRYIRVATGVDYHDAAPVTGLAQGAGASTLQVQLSVGQQQLAV